jgi:hypothetical protein
MCYRYCRENEIDDPAALLRLVPPATAKAIVRAAQFILSEVLRDNLAISTTNRPDGDLSDKDSWINREFIEQLAHAKVEAGR